MASPGEAQPVKRRPGRPRKAPESPPAEPVIELESTGERALPADERIGEHVDDPRWTAIVFPDDRQYRIENGVIVERVR